MVSNGRKKWLTFASLMIAMAAVIAAGFVFVLRESKGPVFKGRSSKEWFLDLSERRANEGTLSTIREMGTNGVPIVADLLRGSESPMQARYRTLYGKLPSWVAKRIPKPAPIYSHYNGGYAFYVMGPQIKASLIPLLEDKSPAVRAAAAAGLKDMQRPGGMDTEKEVPALAKALGDENSEVRFQAALTLGQAGERGAAAVASLTRYVKEAKSGTANADRMYSRLVGIRALGKIGEKSSSAVPELTSLLKDDDPTIRVAAATALWRITKDITNTLPVMMDNFGVLSLDAKGELMMAMQEMGTNAVPAIPLFKAELKRFPPNPDPHVVRPFYILRIEDYLKQYAASGSVAEGRE